eukprot:4003814-Amphidinium_carterae.1
MGGCGIEIHEALLTKRLDGFQYAALPTTSETPDKYGPVAMERMMSPGFAGAFSVRASLSSRTCLLS